MNLQPLKDGPAVLHDGAAMALWMLGLDTAEIAIKLRCPQSLVANRLAKMLDARGAGNE